MNERIKQLALLCYEECGDYHIGSNSQFNHQKFAALVAAAEREAMGNIILDYAGRDDLSDSDESLLKHLFELIRARGET